MRTAARIAARSASTALALATAAALLGGAAGAAPLDAPLAKGAVVPALASGSVDAAATAGPAPDVATVVAVVADVVRDVLEGAGVDAEGVGPAVPVDEADPSGVVGSDNVRLLSTIAEPGLFGARFRDGLMYATGVTGLVIYDVTNPTLPREVGRLPLPHFENEDVDLGGDILLISNDAAESTGILYVVDISDPTAPGILSRLDLGGSPAGGPGHTASCILDCTFAWVTDSNGYLVVDLRDPAAPVAVGTYPTPAMGDLGLLHDAQVDADGLVWAVGYGGTAAYRLPEGYDGRGLGELVTSTGEQAQSQYGAHFGLADTGVNDFIHHNSLRPAGSSTVYVTEEDYTRPGCRGAGSFQRWTVALDEETGAVVPGQEMVFDDLWVTELVADTASPAAVCSAHYFDVRGGLVAQGWYEQGVRFLDVTGDEIRQVGFWTPPTTATWAAYFPPTDGSGEIVYAIDATRGIDVLRIDLPEGGPAAAPTLVAPIRPEWRDALPGTAASEALRDAGRLAAAA